MDRLQGWTGRGLLVLLIVGVLAPGAAGAPATTIRIVMNEYRFTPDAVALRAGQPVRLEIQNRGTVVHEFRTRVFRGVDVWVRTPGFDTRSERMEVIVVRPAAIATIEFTRKTPGDYEFWCSATTNGRRHRDMGMRGKFVVSP